MTFTETPFIVYHVMSFNRLPLIRNLLLSFQLCNVYPNYKWVIADYGSEDGSREFLRDFSKGDPKIELFFDDERRHFEQLQSLDLAPRTKNQRLAVIGGLFRNEVRKRIKADLYFDLSDDHQFVRRGDWVREAATIFNDRVEVAGLDDLTGVVTRAFMYSRHLKKDNAVFPVRKTKEGIDYFIYHEKAFDNYCMMRRSTFERIGSFLQIDQLQDSAQIKAWQDDAAYIHFHPDYSQRAAKLGLKRASMKFPYVVEFPNDIIPNIKSDFKSPFVPLFDKGEIESKFSTLHRPVSSDEIFLEKGICNLKVPVSSLERKFHINIKSLASYFN